MVLKELHFSPVLGNSWQVIRHPSIPDPKSLISLASHSGLGHVLQCVYRDHQHRDNTHGRFVLRSNLLMLSVHMFGIGLIVQMLDTNRIYSIGLPVEIPLWIVRVLWLRCS